MRELRVVLAVAWCFVGGLSATSRADEAHYLSVSGGCCHSAACGCGAEGEGCQHQAQHCSCGQCGCQEQEEEDDACGCEEEEEPWKLFDCCCLKRRKITLTGWVDQGFTWNPDSPADRFNGPNSFNDRANEYQLNQLYMYAERLADNGGCGWAWGGRIDLLYGTDWRWTPTGGLEDYVNFTPKWNQQFRFYGLALPQSYLEFAYNKLSVKVGHYYTIIGYEVVPATGNFFYSHAYTHQYGEPFTHTGFLTAYKPNDNWVIYNGLHRGWDLWEDNNDDLGYLGGITWTSTSKKTSLAYALSTSPEDNLGIQDRYVNSIVFTRKPTDKLTYVLSHDLGFQDDAGVGGASDAEWYSLVNYLFYQLNDCWSVGGRWEWFRDDDGFRVAPPGTLDPRIGETRGFFPGSFYEMTYGLNYKPNKNVIWRPELRWDYYDGPTNANGQLPYDDGTSDDQFTLGTDLIVTF